MTKIYVCITGDLFHSGHISFLKKARNFGDYLVVGVCSDEDVAAYKWPPILNLNQRVAVIESCKLVDEVISLPIHTELDNSNQEYIIEKIIHFFK